MLKGDTRRSDDARFDLGANVLVLVLALASWCDRLVGFAGILGLSARLAGGGNEALFDFRSDGLSRALNLAEFNSPGERCPALGSGGTETVEFGVVGR